MSRSVRDGQGAGRAPRAGTPASAPDGRALDGRALDGRALDGRALDGRALDDGAHASDGRTADGPTAYGPTADGPTAYGPTTDGPTAYGPTADSGTADGGGGDSRSVLVRLIGPVVSPRTWLAMVYLVSGIPLSALGFILTVTGFALGVGLLPLALIGLPVLALTLLGCSSLGRIERRRTGLLLDQVVRSPLVRVAPEPSSGPWLRIWAILRDGTRWRHAASAVFALPVTVVGFVAATSIWAVALALVLLPAYNSALPKGGAVLFGHVLHGGLTMTIATTAGVLVTLVAPHITRGLALMQVSMDRALLGPGSRRDLAARVGDLERSRSRMLAVASTERRRIERDLHDGAQARLVSVAMELGRAKARFAEDPEGARALVDQAHEEAKAALTELRNLVRGVHPPVLSDRGLDAALSGLAALCPVPVTVEVDMVTRASPTVEAVAYFVVSEALTNIAKHAQAHRAAVSVRADGGVVRVSVRDDGHGGAQLTGAGLAGLADRVQAVDGRLWVTSPVGGPTVVEAELPCGL